MFGCESISIKAEFVTFFLRYGFKEAFDVIALGDHIDKTGGFSLLLLLLIDD